MHICAILAMGLLGVFTPIGCASHNTATDTNSTIVETDSTIVDTDCCKEPTETLTPTKEVLLSQDFHDNDNYSMARIASYYTKHNHVKILAFDITGKDVYDKAGDIYSALLPKDVPIFVNHKTGLSTRVTPTNRFDYNTLVNLGADGVMDSLREDSTEGLKRVLRGSDGDVTYISGGHLHNLADLMRDAEGLELVRTKISTLVLGSGIEDFSKFKPEMNFTQGVGKDTGTSEATKFVFSHTPSNVNIVIPSGWTSDTLVDITSILGSNDPLRYLVTNGYYYHDRGDKLSLGDFGAMLYGIEGIGYLVPANFVTNKYGAVISKGAPKPNNFIWKYDNYPDVVNKFKQYIKE